MFRSGLVLPLHPPPTPYWSSSFNSPTSHSSRLLRKRTCVFKIRSNCGPKKIRALQYRSAATRGPLHPCSSWWVGPWRRHSVVSISQAQLQVEFLDRQESLFRLGPLEVPIGLCCPRSSFCCKHLPLFFPSHFRFFLERSRIDTPLSHRWSLDLYVTCVRQCSVFDTEWVNEWMKDGCQGPLRYFSLFN